MISIKRMLPFFLLLLGAHTPEPNDHPRGAKKIHFWAHDILDDNNDVDWFNIKNHAYQDLSLYLQVGTGALCGCPKGDQFIPIMVVFTGDGTLLGYKIGTQLGDMSISMYSIPHSYNIYVGITGTLDPQGTHGYSEYNLLVF